MKPRPVHAAAIVGVGAILPEATDASTFWANVEGGRYSISEVPRDRWDTALYYDPDPKAPDKTYSKIGGWVREFAWDPLGWKLPIPPKVAAAMDDTQKWAISGTRAALLDYGWPQRPLDRERTAVILGNAMAGEKHYWTAFRVMYPELAHQLADAPSFRKLSPDVQRAILDETHANLCDFIPGITEDTMPGELANVLAGRVANVFDFKGPNFVCDAACASAMSAMSAAVDGLAAHAYDAVVTGGIDRNMMAHTFVKFCKIGALSATGTRPYGEGADGFVMGEGAAVFLLKRLDDAERDGDRIYAVILGLGGSSDGKGKGITAPNPVGQRLAVERAWRVAGLDPSTVSYVEGHGTSTRVGDAVEVEALSSVFAAAGATPASIALGSVKSNIGHLKAAAGAAGLLKAALSLHHKVLPPSLGVERPSTTIDFEHSPFRVNTERGDWPEPPCGVRRAGVSAFGFGGTNFHAVLEEHVPGAGGTRRAFTAAGVDVPAVQPAPPAVSEAPTVVSAAPPPPSAAEVTVSAAEPAVSASGPAARPVKAPVPGMKAPLRGAVVVGADNEAALAAALRALATRAGGGYSPAPAPPSAEALAAPVRVAIDHTGPADLAAKAAQAATAVGDDRPATRKVLAARGVFFGGGAPGKVAFLYTGQGSQYVNMLRDVAAIDPVVAATFAEADEIMTPFLGRPLSSFVFADGDEAVAEAEQRLLRTEYTQPAVLTVDVALTRLLAAYGIEPDMVMGHSLGEYGALVAAGSLSFAAALEAVSARGREMADLQIEDHGAMAAVMAPLEEIERIVAATDGYAVIANVNSTNQAVIGGATAAVRAAMDACADAGYSVMPLPVSHAFHTSIVAPVSAPLRTSLMRLELGPPRLPVVANVDGRFYPTGGDIREQMLDILARQVASPVQFVTGLHTLYDAGARIFVEVGPKKALQGFAEEVLGRAHDDVVTLLTNHPKGGGVATFNQGLCGLYAAGLGASSARPTPVPAALAGRVVARSVAMIEAPAPSPAPSPADGPAPAEPVVITGAGLGLPGGGRIFDDTNVGRLLAGEQLIGPIPADLRQRIVDKHITRLVKRDTGDPTFETIDTPDDVIKLAGRGGALDLAAEFGVEPDRAAALDRVTQLAIGAGLDALRDAGIPLVMRYKTTTVGSQLPTGFGLPDALRDDTGVIFASAFPGMDAFATDLERYHRDRARREQLAALDAVRATIPAGDADSATAAELDRRIGELRSALESDPFVFDRRFLFRALAMGHSQFAELIGARGPNTQLNAACASTTQAVALAEDWIRAGRCRRVVVVAGDDVTSDHLLEWVGAGFLASGAAATDERVEDAALPFDNRRHGMLLGMGAAGFVVESAAAARERGIRPICEVLAAVTANSAFHGTRLDVDHISSVMEQLVRRAEARGVERAEIAPKTVFVSHETYTPARGGSAAAEVNALRRVFGDRADDIVVANTKGFTGHTMGVGVEDVVAVKALETGVVPPVANFRDVDPDLGRLNLSRGGSYPVEYALRLAAGFGSQISMTLLRRTPGPDRNRPGPDALGYETRIADPAVWKAWLASIAGTDDPALEVVQRRLRIVVPDRAGSAAPVVTEDVPTVPIGPEGVVAAPGGAQPVAAEPLAAEPVITEPVPDADVAATVVGLVAEQTGYPPDLLDVDLDLEADLGIDTVKQAEVFAAIREHFAIPRDDNLKLRDYPTLGHVIGFVRDRAGITEAVTAEPVVAEPVITEPVPDVDVAATVVGLVAEQTGYPPDLLDLDLDLEADLGIDTVKQAEVFAAIREHFAIPRDDNLKLRDYPTLGHVIGFVRDRTGITEPGASGEGATESAAADAGAEVPAAITGDLAAADVAATVVGLVAEQTGYPPDLLDLDLDLEADLGIDTVKQAEVFAAIREHFAIPRDDNLKLRDYPTLGHVIGFVRDRAGSTETVTAEAVAAEPVITEPVPDADVAATVVGLVAEQTGYPPDLLDVDLDLEADLGIDTVKQAEVFAAIREHFAIPRDDNLKLRDYPTLGHVIGFVRDRAGSTTAVQPAGEITPGPARVRTVPADAAALAAGIDTANTVPRRIPVPLLRPPLEWCTPTGVSLAAGSRVIVMADRGGVARALTADLAHRGVTTLVVDDAPDADGLAARIDGWLADGAIHGVYWLAALDDEGSIDALEGAAWKEGLRIRVKLLYATARHLLAAAPDTPPFLVTATRLGGRHGYDAPATAPMGGAVTGFTKAYRREQPTALVKAVDFAADADAPSIAADLIGETLRDPGCVEVGHRRGQRTTVSLAEHPLAADPIGPVEIGPDTVFVVTGAAGGIVSAVVADLAAASGGVFHLLDLIPEPVATDADLARLTTDRDGLRRDVAERLKAAGERPTPVLIERQLSRLERSAAGLGAITAIEAAGGEAHWHQVDLTDTAAVTAALAAAGSGRGRIDVLIHAAGLEISRMLADKAPSEFDLVFDVKADGLFNLLHASRGIPVGSLMVFSSVAGRFGNGGQTDYSAANDLLCKTMSALPSLRPGTSAVAIDWTAWSGIGMATRGSIPKMMERAGIDMLEPDAGVPTVRREILAGTAGEVVVGRRLGIMTDEWHPTGGIDPDAAAVNGPSDFGPMAARVTAAPLFGGIVVETPLDPTEQPFLDDHRIDGTPVLPGVMGIEAFAEAARLLLPDWHVAGVEDVEFLAPFKFYRDEPRTVVVEARAVPSGDDAVTVACRLLGRRALAGGQEQETVHFTGTVGLSRTAPPPPERRPAPHRNGAVAVGPAAVYQVYFHGPAYRVLAGAWRDGGDVIGEFADGLPADLAPGGDGRRGEFVMSPRLMELCFQTAGIWQLGHDGRMALPRRVGRVSAWAVDGPAGIEAIVTPAGDGYDAVVVGATGEVLVRMSGYGTVEVPTPMEDGLIVPLRAAMV